MNNNFVINIAKKVLFDTQLGNKIVKLAAENEIKKISELLLQKKNIIVSGKSGSGKSSLVVKLLKNLTDKKICIFNYGEPSLSLYEQLHNATIYSINDWIFGQGDKDKITAFFKEFEKVYDIVVFDELVLLKQEIKDIIYDFCIEISKKGGSFILVVQFERDIGDTYIAKNIIQFIDYNIEMLDRFFFPLIKK